MRRKVAIVAGSNLRVFCTGEFVTAARLNELVAAIKAASDGLEALEAAKAPAPAVGVVAGLLTAAAASGSAARFSRRSILMPWRRGR